MTAAFELPGSVDDLLQQLASVPWFRHIGESPIADASVKRMHKWEDWPGPEEPSVSELSERQQRLYDQILDGAGKNQEQLKALWDRIHSLVFEAATPVVPYDAQQDAWHGPTATVWQAAWTAGLIGLCLQTGRAVPSELQDQWKWYVRGHWPAATLGFAPATNLGRS